MTELRARALAFSRLLESPSRDAISPPVVEALLTCCDDLIGAGEASLALDVLDRASRMKLSDSGELMVRLRVRRVRALASAGKSEESLAEVRSLLGTHSEILRQRPEMSWGLRVLEAECLWHLGRLDEAISNLISVRRELLVRPDSDLLARCALQLQCAYSVQGDYEKSRAFGLEALVSARRVGSPEVEALALDNLSRIDRALCRWSLAQENAEAAKQIFEERGNRIALNHCLRGLAVTAFKQGRLDNARRFSDEALRDAAGLGIELLSSYLFLLNALISLHRGSFDEAKLHLAEIGEMHLDTMNPRPHLLSLEYLGDIQLEQGHPAEALRYYNEVWPKAIALVPKGDIVAELRRRRADCYLLLGRPEEAYAESKATLTHCRELGDRYEEAATYRVLATSAAAMARPAEARGHFSQGFAYFEDIETPYEWGKLWLAYGDWLSGSSAGPFSDVAAAREAYVAASDLFERMGAMAKLGEARARLAAMSPTDAGQRSTLTATHDAARQATPTGPKYRRPRVTSEIERKSAWAYERFGLVTRNRSIFTLLGKAEKLATSRAAVLVLGESGTGKELVAHGLHRLSGRPGKWKPINCSTLPREMIESELFGHEAGAFTGALKAKPGLLEVCIGGTAFLDEVGEMPLELQTRLLRFLENGELRRVGGTDEIHSDARVVAATNRDRAKLERGEGMRLDLYYRVAHAVIELPPLRRRGDDIALLIDHFLADACQSEKKQVTFGADARARLLAYGWPGNVRQLKVAVRRAVLFAEDGAEVQGADLELENSNAPASLAEELAIAERGRIEAALQASGGSRTQAARALGMPRTTLVHKMKRLGMVKDE